MAYNPERKSTLLELYAKIESVCKAHIAISSYNQGEVEDIVADDTTYPLAFLESISEIQENQNKTAETYTIALNLLDREPKDSPYHDCILIQDKLKQIFTEIKSYLESRKVYGDTNVSPAALLLFREVGEDNLIRLRGEFTIEIEGSPSAPLDFQAIFRF